MTTPTPREAADIVDRAGPDVAAWSAAVAVLQAHARASREGSAKLLGIRVEIFDDQGQTLSKTAELPGKYADCPDLVGGALGEAVKGALNALYYGESAERCGLEDALSVAGYILTSAARAATLHDPSSETTRRPEERRE